jgi:hypothetical protein
MNAEVTYDLYEERSRWSRAVVIGCVIAVVLLALWIFVPPFLTRIAASHHKDSTFAIVASPQQQPVRIISIDKSPTRHPSDDVARPVATGSIAAIDVSHSPAPGDAASPSPIAPDAPVANAQVREIPTAAASSAMGVGTSDAWAPSAPATAAESSFEAEISAAAPPRLPRARPHLTAAGTLPIPLPQPRPFIPTEDSSSALPDVAHERPDYL